MTKVIKTWLLSILIITCSCLTTFAKFSDCELIASQKYTQEESSINQFNIISQTWGTGTNKYSNFLDINTQLAIIDTGSLNTAILNLKKYCCYNKLWWLSMKSETCKVDQKFFNDNALDSPYLFDHLFDVEMRRLYGSTWTNNIYTKTNMQVDSAWELNWSWWRARIDDKATDLSWANTQEMIDKYKRFWTKTPNSKYDIASEIEEAFSKSNHDFLTYTSGQWSSDKKWESVKIANALKEYEKRTLYDRYNNACAISEYLYALLTVWLPNGSITDKNTVIHQLSKNSCRNNVKSFIEAETAYTKYSIQLASNKLLNTYIDTYKEYLDGRSKTLTSIRRNSADRFSEVVKAVPKLVSRCSK